MMNLMTRALALVCIALCVATASAQTATGTSGTTCTQVGTVLTCTTSTTVTLPSGVSLTPATGVTQFGLVGSGPTGPACTPLTASPSVITPGVNTAILLSVACPTGNYTYTWASPVVGATGSSTTTALTLTANNSQTYQVTVCLASNTSACNTYSATVSTNAGTPALSSCSVSPPSLSINQGSTGTLTAVCATGTGAGSGVSYSWSRNGNQIGTGAIYQITANDTAAIGTSTYSVAVTNNAPSSTSASASVTVTSVANSSDYCPSTPVRATFDASSPYTRIITSNFVNTFAPGDNFVIQLNVAGGDTTVGRQVALLGFSDIGTNRGGRYVTLSQSKCDYTANAKWVTAYQSGAPTAQNGATATVSLNEQGNVNATVSLTTGRWYINIQNVVGFCPANSSCHAVLDWAN